MSGDEKEPKQALNDLESPTSFTDTLSLENPWDIAPVSPRGDQSFQITLTAKGYATDAWEQAEVALSELYASLMNDKWDGKPSQVYGKPLNFKDRLDGLERVGEKFFLKNCSQKLEGDFEDIVLLARMLSMRRNDIVHSIARPVLYDTTIQEENGVTMHRLHYWFYLVPPTYTDRKYNNNNKPAFMYTSWQIHQYEGSFSFIAVAANNLAHRLRNPLLSAFDRKHQRQQT